MRIAKLYHYQRMTSLAGIAAMLHDEEFSGLSEAQLDQIDATCDRYEAAWTPESVDGIEQHLASVDEELREPLFRELLSTELDHLHRHGQQPPISAYLSRFPDLTEIVKQVFETEQSRRDNAVTQDGKNEDTDSFSRAEARQIAELPREFGRYRLLKLLGRGGMGTVYLAHDTELDRRVALKMPEFGATSAAIRATINRFKREARAMATVSHPNLCQIYDVGEKDGHPYLTMAFINGRSLSELVAAQQSFSADEAVQIVLTLARAMQAVHRAGIVHRDLKPANVMVDRDRQLFITDFGLASRDAASEAELTHSGLVLGSPAYMAPEQVNARHDRIGPRTDVYALGVILYQLLTRRRPFEGTGFFVLGQISSGWKPPPPSKLADVNPSLEAICLKAMAHRIEDRYQSAAELAVALEEYASGPESPAGRISRSLGHTRLSSPRGKLVAAAITISLLLGVVFLLPGAKNSADKTSEIAAKNSEPSSVAALKRAVAPFDEAQAKAHQKAWADHLGVPVEYTNSIGMKFVLIPPGEFTMGSTPEEIEAALRDVATDDKHWQECIKSAAPQHKVILTQPIYLGVNEVTQAEYEKVMGVNPSHFAPMGLGKEAVAGMETADHPVERVNWHDAVEFCAKLSTHEKLKPFYFRAGETITPLDGTGYRLPSEAEWEFACRAGTTTKYWIGDNDEDLVRAGWFGKGPGTHATGLLTANPFGLYDIHGNVWEWVQDGWDAAWYGQYQAEPAINPNSPFFDGSERVIRGGNWYYPASSCRSSDRRAFAPASRDGALGFRVSLVAEAVKAAVAAK